MVKNYIDLRRELFFIESGSIKNILNNKTKLSSKYKIFLNVLRYAFTVASFNMKYYEDNGQLRSPGFNYGNIYDLDKFKNDVDLNSPLFDELAFTAQEKDWVHKLIQKNYLASELKSFIRKNTLTFEELIVSKALLSREEAIITIAKDIVATSQAFFDFFELNSEVIGIELSDIKEIIKNPAGAKLDKTDFMDHYLSSNFLTLIMGRNTKFDALVSSLAIDENKSILNHLGDFGYSSKLVYFSNDKKYVELVDGLIEETKSFITLAFNTLNTKNNYNRFKKIISDIKSEAKKDIKFDEEKYQNLFNKKLDRLNINFATATKAEIKKTIIKQLDGIINEVKREIRAYKNNKDYIDQSVLTEVVIADFIGKSIYAKYIEPTKDNDAFFLIKKEVFEDVEDKGFKGVNSALSDHVYSIMGESFLSWSTVRFPSYGVSVAAHEVGHYVQRILSSPEFISPAEGVPGGIGIRYLSNSIPAFKKLQCIKKWHKNVESNKHGQFSGEDWADYFSAKIVKRLKVKHPWLKNGFCSLMLSSDDGYLSLEVKNDKDSQAVHSEALFRVIHFETEFSGDLPNSCQKIVDTKKIFDCD